MKKTERPIGTRKTDCQLQVIAHQGKNQQADMNMAVWYIGVNTRRAGKVFYLVGVSQ